MNAVEIVFTLVALSVLGARLQKEAYLLAL